MDSIRRELASKGTESEVIFCKTFAEMTTAAAELGSVQGSGAVVAAGGDGTINAVFNGLAGNRATCAIIPMGTANVMALELGIVSAHDAAGRIAAAVTRPLTAGLIRNSGHESRFFLMAGAGFDGRIVRGVTLKAKKLLGKGAYGLSALRTLASWDSTEISITTEREEFSCNSLIVTNSAKYGGSFVLCRDSSLFTPAFELLAIKGGSRCATIRALTDALTAKDHSTALYRTSAAKITINGRKPVQADGDDWGDSPLEITAEPGYAEIIV